MAALKSLGVFFVVAGVALLFAAVGMYINNVSDAPCSLMNPQWLDPEAREKVKYCTMIPKYMKVLLIATHLLAFALFPFAMHVFWVRAPQLLDKGAIDPFYSILGFAFLMVAIAGEIGWHVSQQWFYQEDYHVLNFVFYFFFILGVAGWAHGIKINKPGPRRQSNKPSDLVLTLVAITIVTVAYAVAATIMTLCPKADPGAEGAAASENPQCSHLPPATKVPIYMVMLVEFIVLTRRLCRILNGDRRVLLVPFFSVGVNLFFIFLLNLESNKNDVVKNPLFHILHDLAGTELGVLVATWLVLVHTSNPKAGVKKSL